MCPEPSKLVDKPKARSRFLAQCQNLGMSQAAVDSWEEIHVQVELAMAMWFTI